MCGGRRVQFFGMGLRESLLNRDARDSDLLGPPRVLYD